VNYQFIQDLIAEVTIPKDGILSRVLHDDQQARVVIFGFAAGQELSEHTSKFPALLHVLEGEAGLKLGDDERDARAGAWVHMPPNLPHGVLARTPAVILLVLLKGGA
jgi:quercetin dioxygenase-like cupin family protein